MFCESKFKNKNKFTAMAGMAQLVGLRPTKQKVASSIPCQGARLDCGFGPRQGTYEKQSINVSLSHKCFSPFLSPSLPLSLKINK